MIDRVKFLIARLRRDEARLAAWSLPRADVLGDLDGKTVALVGNARALGQGADGARIDAADIVIRINRAPGTGTPSHGNRTDWLALAARIEDAALTGLDPGLVLWMSHKRKRLTFAAVRRRFFLYPQSAIDDLWQRLGAQPTTGAMMIDFLSASRARKVELFGFDFFASRSLSGRRSAEQVPHDFPAERRFVEALMARDPRFTLVPMPKGDSAA